MLCREWISRELGRLEEHEELVPARGAEEGFACVRLAKIRVLVSSSRWFLRIASPEIKDDKQMSDLHRIQVLIERGVEAGTAKGKMRIKGGK